MRKLFILSALSMINLQQVHASAGAAVAAAVQANQKSQKQTAAIGNPLAQYQQSHAFRVISKPDSGYTKANQTIEPNTVVYYKLSENSQTNGEIVTYSEPGHQIVGYESNGSIFLYQFNDDNDESLDQHAAKLLNSETDSSESDATVFDTSTIKITVDGTNANHSASTKSTDDKSNSATTAAQTSSEQANSLLDAAKQKKQDEQETAKAAPQPHVSAPAPQDSASTSASAKTSDNASVASSDSKASAATVNASAAAASSTATSASTKESASGVTTSPAAVAQAKKLEDDVKAERERKELADRLEKQRKWEADQKVVADKNAEQAANEQKLADAKTASAKQTTHDAEVASNNKKLDDDIAKVEEAARVKTENERLAAEKARQYAATKTASDKKTADETNTTAKTNGESKTDGASTNSNINADTAQQNAKSKLDAAPNLHTDDTTTGNNAKGGEKVESSNKSRPFQFFIGAIASWFVYKWWTKTPKNNDKETDSELEEDPIKSNTVGENK